VGHLHFFDLNTSDVSYLAIFKGSYWDEDCPDWGAEEHDFATAWRSQPKWVVSRTLKSVGPNATLVENDIEAVIRGLKAQPVGEIEVAGGLDWGARASVQMILKFETNFLHRKALRGLNVGRRL
jgi:hypothetical protein